MKAEFSFNIGRFVVAIAIGAGLAEKEQTGEGEYPFTDVPKDPNFKMGFNAE